MPDIRRQLTVFVLRDCPGWRSAQRIADTVGRRCPQVQVQVIELSSGAPQPGVIGVPAYLLDGRVISLGNPELPALLLALGVDTTTEWHDDGLLHR